MFERSTLKSFPAISPFEGKKNWKGSYVFVCRACVRRWINSVDQFLLFFLIRYSAAETGRRSNPDNAEIFIRQHRWINSWITANTLAMRPFCILQFILDPLRYLFPQWIQHRFVPRQMFLEPSPVSLTIFSQ